MLTVEELIEILKTMPKDYEVASESGDAYGSAYLAYADEVDVNHKDKEVEIKE
jgi:hypothetical protein